MTRTNRRGVPDRQGIQPRIRSPAAPSLDREPHRGPALGRHPEREVQGIEPDQRSIAEGEGGDKSPGLRPGHQGRGSRARRRRRRFRGRPPVQPERTDLDRILEIASAYGIGRRDLPPPDLFSNVEYSSNQEVVGVEAGTDGFAHLKPAAGVGRRPGCKIRVCLDSSATRFAAISNRSMARGKGAWLSWSASAAMSKQADLLGGVVAGHLADQS